MNEIAVRIFKFIIAGALLVGLTSCGGSSYDPIKIKAGETISFTDNKTGGLANGWSYPESDGTWTASDNASLNFEYQEKFDRGLKLRSHT